MTYIGKQHTSLEDPRLAETHAVAPWGIKIGAEVYLEPDYEDRDLHAASRYTETVMTALEEWLCYNDVDWRGEANGLSLERIIGGVDLPFTAKQAIFCIERRGVQLRFSVWRAPAVATRGLLDCPQEG